jgi:hypothetical protein
MRVARIWMAKPQLTSVTSMLDLATLFEVVEHRLDKVTRIRSQVSWSERTGSCLLLRTRVMRRRPETESV